MFVIADLDDDMHDGTVAQGGTWLKDNLSSCASWAKTNNSLLAVTWDEDDYSGSNQIPTLFAGANIKPGQYNETVNPLRPSRRVSVGAGRDSYAPAHGSRPPTTPPALPVNNLEDGMRDDSSGLLAWLRQQLDMDERLALAAGGALWGIYIPPMVHVGAKAKQEYKQRLERLEYVATVEREDHRVHIAAHDPARVLRAVVGKRALLDLYAEADRWQAGGGTETEFAQGRAAGLGIAVRAMAAEYADRPGYRQEWRP